MAEWQAAMSAREFAEWMAYNQIEPLTQARADLRSALIAWILAEIHRDPDKRRKPFEVQDFMPVFDGEAEDRQAEPDPRELWQRLKAWALSAGGGKHDDP